MTHSNSLLTYVTNDTVLTKISKALIHTLHPRSAFITYLPIHLINKQFSF